MNEYVAGRRRIGKFEKKGVKHESFIILYQNDSRKL